MIKFSRNPMSFPEIWAKLLKTAASRNVEESKNIPGSVSGSGWRPKFNQFFLVNRYITVKFHEDLLRPSRFYLKLITDRQADRQMPGVHNLLGKVNKAVMYNLNASVSPISDKNVFRFVNSDTCRTFKLAVAVTVRTKTESQLSVIHSKHLRKTSTVTTYEFQSF